ncbi:MAG: mitochondrial 37S ribosomal protein nam9 [Bathelium mastoideum]|nr:MAG: mitochondrial 37S ribosomal protein nam9 [Bathelium mastoideum]
MRKRAKLHTLKKIKVRQSWNKFNLYNLSRLQKLTTEEKTFFQQKWAAKAITRAYHGEHIREKQWQRMFNTRIPSVQSMDHRYLAQHDGSEQATGRGSGLDASPGLAKKIPPKTPYMQMVYGPTERRLDTAIWRALFASSVRQARQFVTHGGVKVNGTKMIYPGYQLNPGDMFQVDPDRVMFATGAMKNQDKYFKAQKAIENTAEETEETEEGNSEGDQEATSDSKTESAQAAPTQAETDASAEDPDLPLKQRKKTLKNLLDNAKVILEDPHDRLSANRKKEWRAFSKLVRSTLSRARLTSDDTASDLEAQLQTLKAKLQLSSPSAAEKAAVAEAQQREQDLSAEEEETLRAALQRARDNPVDDGKPYATPWRPRPYMSAFAFIPRFLEVNQAVCAAVYLRHPVARPGLAEVPTPFHLDTSQLAFSWYLRRR